MAGARGVRFLYDHTIEAAGIQGGRVAGIVVKRARRREATMTADAYVVALASYSPLLTGTIGLYLPIYPGEGLLRPPCRVADPALHLTVSPHRRQRQDRLLAPRRAPAYRGPRPEPSGYSTDLNPVRCEALIPPPRARSFPGAERLWTARLSGRGCAPRRRPTLPLVGADEVSESLPEHGHGNPGLDDGLRVGAGFGGYHSRAKSPTSTSNSLAELPP
jgi:D-amino-acid dehydrogenase